MACSRLYSPSKTPTPPTKGPSSHLQLLAEGDIVNIPLLVGEGLGDGLQFAVGQRKLQAVATGLELRLGHTPHTDSVKVLEERLGKEAVGLWGQQDESS